MKYANYKHQPYLFNLNRKTKNHEIVTEKHSKADLSFQQYKYCYFKEVSLSDPDLTDIFDVQLWVEHNTGFDGFPTEWNFGLDGYDVIDGKIVIETSKGHVPGWEVIDKCESRGFIDPKDIQGAWVLYMYQKKDGVILDEPMVVREDVSVERLLELRRFYGVGAL